MSAFDLQELLKMTRSSICTKQLVSTVRNDVAHLSTEYGEAKTPTTQWWLPDRIRSQSIDTKDDIRSFQESDLLRREYFKRRKFRPVADINILVVITPDKEVVSVGRPVSWREGVAEAVKRKAYKVHELQFTMKRNIDKEEVEKDDKTEAKVYSENLCFGEHSDAGCRRDMEDKHVAEINIVKWFKDSDSSSEQPQQTVEVDEGVRRRVRRNRGRVDKEKLTREVALFAVFDGHRGDKASMLAQERFPRLFCKHVLENVDESSRGVDIAVALKSSLGELEEVTLQTAELEGWDSGTTAVIGSIHKNKLVLCNIGDSRAVLCRAGKAVSLTKDQNLKVAEEVQMVTRAGGSVSDGYLNGQLSVSRAIGDFDLDAGRKLRGLSATPVVTAYELTYEDEFVIFACDGLWDVFPSQHAVAHVRLSLRRHANAFTAAEELVQEALRRGSSDNVTVIIVSFHKRPNFRWKEKQVPAFNRRRMNSRALKTHTETPPSSRKQRPKIDFSAFSRDLQQTLLQAAHNTEAVE